MASNSPSQSCQGKIGSLTNVATCQSCCRELTTYHKHWSCENNHKTCNDCYMDLLFEAPHDRGNQKEILCTCESILVPIKPVVCGEHVFIYVDDSNMWIEAKKLAARQGNFKCVEDPRLRMDMGKVADFVANGREIACDNLYGSEPPPVDTVWEKIKRCGWKVNLSKRSHFTNREKQVDHRIVKDITALVSDRSVAKGTIILVSGDADLIPAVEEGLSKKWSFEIWMWDSGISKALKKLEEDHPELLTIGSLDPHLEEISFTNFELSEKHLSSEQNDRTAVIKNFHETEAWEKDLAAKLRWPFQFCWIGTDLVLVFSSAKPKDDKQFASHFDKIFEQLQKKYPGRVVHAPAYRREIPKKETEISFTNMYEALEDAGEQLSLSSYYDPPDKNERQEARDHLNQEKESNDNVTEDEFQVVRRKQRKKSQKFSEHCEYGSNCKSGLNCTYRHTKAEKLYFKTPFKHKECKYKNSCWSGPTNCKFAHSDKDSFCRLCHNWGHLRNKCTVESSSTTK